MGGIAFQNRALFHLIWPVLLLGAAWAVTDLGRGDRLARFLSALMRRRLARQLAPGRRLVRLGLMVLALWLVVLALMRPQGPGELTAVGSSSVSADIFVVLDVSRSMLAEDAAPTRLGRAKAEVRDLIARMPGHRLGLVAFAGRAQLLCPLTPDYGFFRMILDSADPRSVSRGGTRIGDGLRAAVQALPPGSGARLVLLITDGEDHDSLPLDAAREAGRAGVRIIAIGFGDERGSEVALVDPTTGARRFLTDREGQLVRSRLDGKTLRDIALATEGAYIPAGVAALDLESIVREHITPLLARANAPAAAQVRTVPREFYPHLLLAALLCLLAWAALGRIPHDS